MYQKANPKLPILIEALRSTIRNLEESEDLQPNDPVLREIKSSIVRVIAARDLNDWQSRNRELEDANKSAA